MAEPIRIFTNPLEVSGGATFDQLVCLVDADVLSRRARSQGFAPEFSAVLVGGDLATQYALERELGSEPADRALIDRVSFVDRMLVFEKTRRERAQRDLLAVGVDLELDADGLDSPSLARAARVAFVRLYEEGLLKPADEVVTRCPRCGTNVDVLDLDEIEVEAERLTVRMRRTDAASTLDVNVDAPELLNGVVAVVVPPDHDAVGAEVCVPIGGQAVPVVGDPGATVTEPTLLVPAHDGAAHEIASGLGLPAVDVIGSDGVVVAAGPLCGAERLAARAAARELLTRDGSVVATSTFSERVARCRRCGSVAVPLLGRCWFLDVSQLEIRAADAIRDGAVAFSPADLRDEVISAAGSAGRWCVSREVWGGQPLPVACCADCGRLAVEVELPASCGGCMGELIAEDASLDARFVAALWPIVGAGWPDDFAPARGIGVVERSSVATWLVRCAALSLHLAGSLPFDRVSVPGEAEQSLSVHDLLARSGGPRAARVALVGGNADVEAARDLADALESPQAGDFDIDLVVDQCGGAFDDAAPWLALMHLSTAAAEGVRSSAADRLRALAAPVLGI